MRNKKPLSTEKKNLAGAQKIVLWLTGSLLSLSLYNVISNSRFPAMRHVERQQGIGGISAQFTIPDTFYFVFANDMKRTAYLRAM